MSWIRENYLAVVVLVAVVASFFVSRAEYHQRDLDRGKALVAGCVSNSARTALIANGQLVLAARVGRRNNPGDQTSAEQYQATARSLTAEIPAPKGLEGSVVLAVAYPVRGPDGTVERYRLSERTKALHAAGCKRRYL